MKPIDFLLWVVIPYLSIAIFLVGHWWRYSQDKFGWTSRSTQLFESRWLAWGSNLFHYGAFAAIAGHMLGILVPNSWTEAVGIPERAYRILAGGGGGLAGIACLVGAAILAGRRLFFRRVLLTTTYEDFVNLAVLGIVIALGIIPTIALNVVGPGYDYRTTVAVWFRGIFAFSPRPELMASAPLIYQLHVELAWLLYALWPFSRLVHAWSAPVQYLGRPWILYRRRFAPGGR